MLKSLPMRHPPRRLRSLRYLRAFGVLLLLAGNGPLRAEGAVFLLRGRVLEKGSRRPVPGAAVGLMGSEVRGRTGPDGVFVLALPGAGHYTAAVLGEGRGDAAKAAFSVSEARPAARVDLFMDPAEYALPDITVTGDPWESAVSRRVLTGKELSSVAGGQGDPLKALGTLPGFATTSDTSSSPAIRGSRPEENA